MENSTLINQGMICQYCLAPTHYHNGNGTGRVAITRYFLTSPHRICLECMAWVKCLPDSELGKGMVANDRLRELKQKVYLHWAARKNELDLDTKNFPNGGKMASAELKEASGLDYYQVNLWTVPQCSTAIRHYETKKIAA